MVNLHMPGSEHHRLVLLLTFVSIHSLQPKRVRQQLQGLDVDGQTQSEQKVLTLN